MESQKNLKVRVLCVVHWRFPMLWSFRPFDTFVKAFMQLFQLHKGPQLYYCVHMIEENSKKQTYRTNLQLVLNCSRGEKYY